MTMTRLDENAHIHTEKLYAVYKKIRKTRGTEILKGQEKQTVFHEKKYWKNSYVTTVI